ncbi:MAG: 4-vinyl reductase [Nanoarchaeota archaeon]|nr:4-vinyl reductase [Nanoarchaeota archaeon]
MKTKKLISVKCPPELEPVFLKAEKLVKNFFSNQKHDPNKAIRTVSGDRYMLIRAEALGYHIRKSAEKIVGRNAGMFIFNFGHAIGQAEARGFHKKFKLKTPNEKLSAGPVHFNYAGFAFVNLLPGCNPIPNNDYVLVYDHPNSFEAQMQLKLEGKSKNCVCHLNAGYSSGWCSESYGLHLIAKEVTCMARGDKQCRFVMAPPDKIIEHIEFFKKKWGLK